MPRGDEVTAGDMDALLAELQDVGGAVVAPGAESRPYVGGQAHGTAGSTSVLQEQHSYATRNSGAAALRRGSGGGGGTVSGAARGSLTSLATGSPQKPLQPNAAEFSSYAPVGMTEGELRSERHAATPLGVRLAPLSVAPNKANSPRGHGTSPSTSPATADGARQRRGGSTAGGSTQQQQQQQQLSPKPPPGTKKPGDRRTSLPSTGSSSGNHHAGARPSLSSGLGLGLAPLPSLGALPPLPPSPQQQKEQKEHADAGAASAAPPRREFSFRSNYRQFLAEADADDAEKRREAERDTPQGNHGGDGEPGDGEYREANFLPIMCARYLNPAGLVPAGRWGHTLTAIGGSASASLLYMFGGMELGGSESNALFQFDTSSLTWEPALVLPPLTNGGSASAPPAPRHNHAACSYEDRYLLICGGATRNASVLFADIHLFDTQTHQWRCLWPGTASSSNKHEPAARFGHTAVVREDRLYIFGGKVLKAGGGGEKATTTVGSNDVYVFSLNSLRWKRRIRGSAGAGRGAVRKGKASSHGAAATDGDDATANAGKTTAADVAPPPPQPAAPPARAYHAATVKGNIMYINGGADAQGHVLGDTWQVDLLAAAATSTGEGAGAWACLHSGQSADAIPRERHDLFACGEALLVVGGCSASMYSTAVSGKFNNFVSVLLAVGEKAGACWIPVAMGNVSIVAPSKKNFAAAFLGGFMYVFGGMCGMEPATNALIRFLAADGYVAADARATTQANDEAIRAQMRQLRERPPVPHDIIAVTDTITSSYGSGSGSGDEVAKRRAGDAIEGALFSDATATAALTREVRLHKFILSQRAPQLLAALQACRFETSTVPLSASSAVMRSHRKSSQDGGHAKANGADKAGTADANDRGDVVDALLHQQQQPQAERGGKRHTTTTLATATATAGAGATVVPSGQMTTYDTTGNSRVTGLPHPLSAEELACLADYVYWGGLPAAFKRLLKDEDEAETEAEATLSGPSHSSDVAASRQHLKNVLTALKQAAEDYQLKPLGQLIDALLAGSRRQLQRAQEKSCAALRKDMEAILDTGSGATCTVLFIDPHTNQQSAHALHPSVLMSASSFFLELLRPLYTGEKTSFQVGPVAAKVSAANAKGSGSGDGEGPSNTTSTTNAATTSSVLLFSSTSSISKRAVLVGPVAVPKLAVQPILRYLYTQQLQVPREFAFEVMLGAHQLGLPLLQNYCEAIVAREEVNYDSCCAFYFLAKKYNAALLEETSLLTAVSGYAEVRHQAAYRNLSDEERKSIDAVAAELKSATWVPPPQPTNEMKSAEVYAARWRAASLS